MHQPPSPRPPFLILFLVCHPERRSAIRPSNRAPQSKDPYLHGKRPRPPKEFTRMPGMPHFSGALQREKWEVQDEARTSKKNSHRQGPPPTGKGTTSVVPPKQARRITASAAEVSQCGADTPSAVLDFDSRYCHPERRSTIRLMNRAPQSKDPYRDKAAGPHKGDFT